MPSINCTFDSTCSTFDGLGIIRLATAEVPPGAISFDGIRFTSSVVSVASGQDYGLKDFTLDASFLPLSIAEQLANGTYYVQLSGVTDEAVRFASPRRTVEVSCTPLVTVSPGQFVAVLPKLIYHLRTLTRDPLVYHLRTGSAQLVHHLRTAARQPLPALAYHLHTLARPLVYHLRTGGALLDGALCVQLMPTGERLLVQVPRAALDGARLPTPPAVLVTSLDGSVSYATTLLPVSDDPDNWYFESDYLGRDGVFVVQVLFGELPRLDTQQHVLVHLRLQFEHARLLQTEPEHFGAYNQAAADIELWLAAVVLVYEQDNYEEADYMLAELYTNLLLYPVP